MKGFDLPVRFTLLGLPAGVCGGTRVSFPGRSPCLAGCVSGAAGGRDVQCHPAAIPSPRALAQPRGMHTIHQPTSYFKLRFPKLLHPCFLLPARTLPAFPAPPPAPLLAAEGLIWEQPCLREPPQGRLPAAATGCASSFLKFTNLSGRLPCQGDKTRCRLHLAAGSELCRPLLERRSHALD